GVAETVLHHLERQLEATVDTPIDAPAGVEVTQRVEPAVLRLAVLGEDAGGHLHRTERAVDDIGMALDAALSVRKNQVDIAFRAGELPLAQGADDGRRQRNRSLPGCTLRLSYGVETIGALADANFRLLQVDIGPAQTAQFRGAHSGEDCGQE